MVVINGVNTPPHFYSKYQTKQEKAGGGGGGGGCVITGLWYVDIVLVPILVGYISTCSIIVKK